MNYLAQLAGRIRDEVPESDIPSEASDELFLAYAVLARVTGVAVTNADVHDAWVAWMLRLEPDHEALMPYDLLDSATQEEDSVFTRAIHKVATNLNS